MLVPIHNELFSATTGAENIEHRIQWCIYYISLSHAQKMSSVSIFDSILDEECQLVELSDELINQISKKISIPSQEDIFQIINVILLSSLVYGEPE